MKILFVNACPRGECSRTLRLGRVFLEELLRHCPGAQIVEHNLSAMRLQPIDAEGLAKREPLCDARAWEDPFLRPAVEFQQADAVVIAAPYWDLAFPSMLKVWVEHVYVRNLTFYYEHDRCIGLCKASEAVYITTAGSPIGDNDWGAGYMQAVLKSLGVNGFQSIRAEGIDLDSCNVSTVLAHAEEQARQAARALAQRLA